MVLEAWEWAEKVWFPVIWEEIKDASNVIDYAINKEITIDTSAIQNANNQTTTGMATVIPWINAPKLIESSSIYNNVYDFTWQCDISWSRTFPEVIPWWWVRMWIAYPLVINSQEWPYNFETTLLEMWWNTWENGAISIPKTWKYRVNITYNMNEPNYFNYTRKVVLNWEFLYTSTNTGSIDILINARQLDDLCFEYTFENKTTYWLGWASFWFSWSVIKA